MEERREDYAYVLDFLQSGKSFTHRAEPVVQLLGEVDVHACWRPRRSLRRRWCSESAST